MRPENIPHDDAVMASLMSDLLIASNMAKMWHWKVKSFSLHMALGELYEGLNEITDELMEMYMGRNGTEAFVEIGKQNVFAENSPLEFITQLDEKLQAFEHIIPPIGFIVNKFQELQAMVSKIKYKIENLR